LLTHLPDSVYHVSFRRYRLLKLPLRCDVVDKRCFGPPICRGEGTPQISDMHFQIALPTEHVAYFGWVPLSQLGE